MNVLKVAFIIAGRAIQANSSMMRENDETKAVKHPELLLDLILIPFLSKIEIRMSSAGFRVGSQPCEGFSTAPPLARVLPYAYAAGWAGGAEDFCWASANAALSALALEPSASPTTFFSARDTAWSTASADSPG